MLKLEDGTHVYSLMGTSLRSHGNTTTKELERVLFDDNFIQSKIQYFFLNQSQQHCHCVPSIGCSLGTSVITSEGSTPDPSMGP